MTEPTTQPTEPTTPANPATPPSTEAPAKVVFTPEQQAAIDALIGNARKEGKAAAERAAQEAKDADEAARTRADQEAKGQYEAAKQALEGERDGLKTERDTLQTERDALLDYFNGQYEAALKDFPESIVAFAPEAGASFAVKQAWLAKATEQAAKHQSQAPGYRVPPTPQAQGRATSTKEQMTADMRGRVSI